MTSTTTQPPPDENKHTESPSNNTHASDDLNRKTNENDILEKRYVYQHPSTGAISSVPLTIRQLCRMFSPPVQKQQIIWTGNTNVLQVVASSTPSLQYSNEGWQPAKSIPILRHAACDTWYSSASTTTTTTPMSFRSLAEQHLQNKAKTKTIHVYSETTGNQWIPIDSLDDLSLALCAFDSVITRNENNPTIQSTTTNTSSKTIAMMTMQKDDDTRNNKKSNDPKEIQKELEAFLSSTAESFQENPTDDTTTTTVLQDNDVKGDDTTSMTLSTDKTMTTTIQKPKKKKAQFAAKNAKCWIYVTGLPPDTTKSEVTQFFSKVGIIDLDPLTQQPKVKLYKTTTSSGDDGMDICKGDASIGYARPESVELALQVLDGAPFRSFHHEIHVERAKFSAHENHSKRPKQIISSTQRKVARLAARQARDWDTGEYNGRLTGGLKGLRIIILKHVFAPNPSDSLMEKIEQELRQIHDKVEKITIFSNHPQGVLAMKFSQPSAASDAIQYWNNHNHTLKVRRQTTNQNNHLPIQALFWDGVTDYTIHSKAIEEEETLQRQEDFGKWIQDSQTELPPEYQLQVEE